MILHMIRFNPSTSLSAFCPRQIKLAEGRSINLQMNSNAPLQEGLDFYIENGRYVFTEHYLRKRGYCCQSGCRHCPYGFKKEEESATDKPGDETPKTK